MNLPSTELLYNYSIYFCFPVKTLLIQCAAFFCGGLGDKKMLSVLTAFRVKKMFLCSKFSNVRSLTVGVVRLKFHCVKSGVIFRKFLSHRADFSKFNSDIFSGKIDEVSTKCFVSAEKMKVKSVAI